MAFGGLSNAIYVDNRPRPPHRFNYDAIGRGQDYLNQALAGDRCIITIQAGIPWRTPIKKLLFRSRVAVECHICTDTQPAVFQGNIAYSLGLRPINPFIRRVDTAFGPYAGYWSRYDLWLSPCPGYMRLEVWFPVERNRRGWDWRYGFPQWNVLGMRGVLNRRMLCVTSEQVYAFVRL